MAAFNNMNSLGYKRIVMIGTSLATQGGVSAVVDVYKKSALFDNYNIIYLSSHCDGMAVSKIFYWVWAWVLFALLLLTGSVGVLHVHTASRASFWRKCSFFFPAFLFRVPVILHLHGGGFASFYDNECGSCRQRVIRSVFNRCARVVVLSNSWRAWVGEMCQNHNVVTMYNPVFLPSRLVQKVSQRNAEKLLFLGKLGRGKGTYDLLEALRVVVSTHPLCRVLMGGNGDLEQTRVLARELGIDSQVVLLGWVRGDEKERLLHEAMVYVLPSYNEGLPMSVLEAMAAGLPIISTPVGGIPEAVTDGVEGFLVTPGDVDALADRIGRLLADPDLARRMGEAARHKVETTFSAEVLVPKIEALYAELGFGPVVRTVKS